MADLRSLARKAVPFEARRILKRIAWLPVDVFERRDPLIPPRGLRLVGGGDYRRIGGEMFRLLVEVGGLKAQDRVLDIGCGTGRVAAPLTAFLTSRYVGFDVVKAEIRWAAANISRRFPNFRFLHADIHNTHYNRSGRCRASEWPFPFPEDSFDFVFLTSVLTHLAPAAVSHYLTEVRRVIAPSGTCFATAFLLNSTSLRHLQEGRCSVKFAHRSGRTMVLDPQVPEVAIGYDEEYLRELIAGAGLRVEETRYGSWAGREDAIAGQDILLLRWRP